MKISTKKRFVASTATATTVISFEVINTSKYEIEVTILECEKSRSKNLKKLIKTLALIKTEFSENDYLVFLSKATQTLDSHRNFLFNDAENIDQVSLLKLILVEIEKHVKSKS